MEEREEERTPSRPSTAFTIDFDTEKTVDQQRLESLAKKSQARHQRVHSMSAGWRRPTSPLSSPSPKAPTSARLPRKAATPQGYRSEGYFSSDQEDSFSRSFTEGVPPSRSKLILPLRSPHAPLWSPRLSDQSLRDVPMIADTSSPELEASTPMTPPKLLETRPESPSSTVSEAGTYTIEADNYTEEQKANMNIDEAFHTEDFAEPIRQAFDKINKERTIREELLLAKTIPDPIRKVSTDKNVLEISCCYQSPTENVPAAAPKTSSKSYLDRLKSRMEKAFHAPKTSPKTPEASSDLGSFTSVTTSGVLSSSDVKVRPPAKLCRKDSLTKSQIDSSEYVHRLPPRAAADNLVLQKVTNESFTPCEDAEHDYAPTDPSEEQLIVGRLSHLSLNRCQGGKSWIQEWAENVKKHNKEIIMNVECTTTGLPPMSPRRTVYPTNKGCPSPTKSLTSPCDSPTKIPSPVSTLVRQRAPVPDILTSTPDTDTYLQNTQNVISSLQAKLQNARSSPLAQLDFTQTLFQDRINMATSKLPVSQLSRSNSLNYRLYRKTASAESSPLRNPGNYLVTGNYGMPSAAKILLSNIGASRSLDTDSAIINRIRRYTPDSNVLRHHRGTASPTVDYEDDFNNANMTQSLNLKSSTRNVFDEGLYNDKRSIHRVSINNLLAQRHSIDQTSRKLLLSPSNQRLQNIKSSHHQRGFSDTYDMSQSLYQTKRVDMKDAQNSPIRRSSSFNIVNKNNNNYDNNTLASPIPRISSAPRKGRMQGSQDFAPRHNTPEVDCMSEDSDNISTGGFYSDYDRRSMRKTGVGDQLLTGARCNRAFALRRARLESPDARPNTKSSSPKCPDTPEMKRKFTANEQNKRPTRAQTRDTRSVGLVTCKISDVRPDVCQVIPDVNKNQKNKKITETVKQTITNRLTRSSSTAKDFLSKSNEKATKKPVKVNTIVTNPKEVEFSNWKKRASYDPMKAAQEGKKKPGSGKTKLEPSTAVSHARIEDASSPSHSSPVHRSRSFNCTKTPIDERLYLLQQLQNDGSSDTDDLEDRLICTMPTEGSTTVPVLKLISAKPELISKLSNAPDVTKRNKRDHHINVKPSSDYIAKMQVNPDLKKPNIMDKRKTYLVEADQHNNEYNSVHESDKRRTYILDSDTTTTTNSTTNGSGSRRNSSVYSDERVNHERLSESEAESDTEPIVNVVHRVKSKSVPPQQRHSGDFSMSSSSCSASKDTPSSKKPIQPRYLDISRFKSDTAANKNFLRRDPSKTYVGVLPVQDQRYQAKKNAAKQMEQEMKNKELEKWKRRASYDPRKAAAQAKLKPASAKSPSNSVLRSQSFHGPMMQTTKLATIPSGRNDMTAEAFYQDISSDNEF